MGENMAPRVGGAAPLPSVSVLKDEKGETALHEAAQRLGCCAINVVKCLVEKGADRGIEDNEGRTAAKIAADGAKGRFKEKFEEVEAFLKSHNKTTTACKSLSDISH